MSVKSLNTDNGRFVLIKFVFLSMLVVIALVVYKDYGISWDEPISSWYGQKVYEYYAHGRDASHFEPKSSKSYGAAYSLPAHTLAKFLPLPYFDTHHLLLAIIGIIGVSLCWSLAAIMGGTRAGLFAGIALILTPSYFGHMFMNPKDLPFAVGYLATLYFFLRALFSQPAVPIGTSVKLGLAFGFLIGVRSGGAFFLLIALSAELLFLAIDYRRIKADFGLGPYCLKVLYRLILPALSVALIVFLISSPWAHDLNLFAQLSESALQQAKFDWSGNVLLLGELINSHNLPWYYVPVYLTAKLPLLFLVLLALLPLMLVKEYRSGFLDSTRLVALFIVVLSALLPLSIAILLNSVLYDGLRHFLFIIPLLAVLAGVSANYIWDRVSGLGWKIKALPGGILLLYIIYHTSVIYRYHPYQYVYYNELVGGIKGAEDRFMLDYWSTSYKELLDGLSEKLNASAPGKVFSIATENIYWYGTQPFQIVQAYLYGKGYGYGNLRYTDQLDKADYALGVRRRGQVDTAPPCDTELIVSRDGVVFSWVRRIIRSLQIDPDEMSIVPDGAKWDACGNRLFSKELEIRLSEAAPVKEIDISLDGNDRYQLSFFDGDGKHIGDHVLGPVATRGCTGIGLTC